jgi:hypothetical protein
MARQTSNAGNTADSDQTPATALRHGGHKGLESRSQTEVVGGKYALHHVKIRSDGGVHANADAGVGNHDVGQTLALDALRTRRANAVDVRHIGMVNLVTLRVEPGCVGPTLNFSHTPCDQRQTVSGLVKPHRQ